MGVTPSGSVKVIVKLVVEAALALVAGARLSVAQLTAAASIAQPFRPLSQ
jgi:hypothetical protein